ncbi:MAG: hypothetical protein KDJ16_12920 [Hyphomicrobiales bacterium]|nr:hypothetical protein [Hyphomicrobiales bacterium]
MAVIALVFTLAFWAVILLGTMPHLRATAGGLEPFDLRFFGYSTDDARQFLAALGTEGRSFYRTIELILDSIFPMVYASTLALIGVLLVSGRFACRRLPAALCRATPVVLAFIAMVLDYRENHLISKMLDRGPEAVGDQLVAAASLMTVAKWIAIAALALVLTVYAVRAALKWKRGGTA